MLSDDANRFNVLEFSDQEVLALASAHPAEVRIIHYKRRLAPVKISNFKTALLWKIDCGGL